MIDILFITLLKYNKQYCGGSDKNIIYTILILSLFFVIWIDDYALFNLYYLAVNGGNYYPRSFAFISITHVILPLIILAIFTITNK